MGERKYLFSDFILLIAVSILYNFTAEKRIIFEAKKYSQICCVFYYWIQLRKYVMMCHFWSRTVQHFMHKCKKKLCHKWIPWNFFMAHRLWFPDCIFNDFTIDVAKKECGNVLSRSKLHFEFCLMRFSISRTFYWIKLPTNKKIYICSIESVWLLGWPNNNYTSAPCLLHFVSFPRLY